MNFLVGVDSRSAIANPSLAKPEFAETVCIAVY
jgi:hypothetical protein